MQSEEIHVQKLIFWNNFRLIFLFKLNSV